MVLWVHLNLKTSNRKRQFVHKIFVHNFVPLNPSVPPPNQQSDGCPPEFILKGPQTELRTLSQNWATKSPKIANKQNCEQRAFPN